MTNSGRAIDESEALEPAFGQDARAGHELDNELNNRETATPFEPDAGEDLLQRLSLRMGDVHARQRLGIEREKESQVVGQGRRWFHLENWYSIHWLIRGVLRLAGLLGRGQRNTRRIRVVEQRFVLPDLPAGLEGFRILHLSDTHVDMDEQALESLLETVRPLDYDLCVLTGDYRRDTWGPVHDALAGMRRLRTQLQGRVLAVLGNHDSIRMVPELETMGYELLLNEHRVIEHRGERLYVAGVDDAHFYRVDNLQKAAEGIPPANLSLLLSHTPEIFRQAAWSGFDLFLCGHTHGGQICLPGGFPLTLDADCPRRLGKGYWNHGNMQGYTSVGAGTSVVNVRLNCPPEVTIHTLTRGAN